MTLVVTGVGSLATIEIRIFGPIKVRWIAEHTIHEPPRMFEDVQVKGPSRSWHHRDIVKQHANGAVLRDEIDYGQDPSEKLFQKKDGAEISPYPNLSCKKGLRKQLFVTSKAHSTFRHFAVCGLRRLFRPGLSQATSWLWVLEPHSATGNPCRRRSSRVRPAHL
jgi:hypothetical protein